MRSRHEKVGGEDLGDHGPCDRQGWQTRADAPAFVLQPGVRHRGQYDVPMPVTAATREVLHVFDLLQRFEREPLAALRELHGRVLAEPSRASVFALAEASYAAGEVLADRGAFLAAAVYAYAYLLGGEDPEPPNPYDRRFRWACDLYNAGLLWEAHEAWERAWRSVDSQAGRELLQGLIQCAAAALKSERAPARDRLLDRALAHLEAAGGTREPLLGVDRPAWIDKVRAWRRGGPRPELVLRIRCCDRPGIVTDRWLEPAGVERIELTDCQLVRARTGDWPGEGLIPHDPPSPAEIETWLERCRAELPENQPFGLVRIGQEEGRVRWRLDVGEPYDEALIAPHHFDIHAGARADLRGHGHGPRCVDAAAER